MKGLNYTLNHTYILIGEGSTLHRARATGGQPPVRHSAAKTAAARVPGGPGTSRLAAHSAQRAAAAVAAGRHQPREDHGG